MAYVKTYLKREIVIDSIVTIHYFEYTSDFIFHGESHDFWEFLYVDQGSVSVTAGDNQVLLNSGDIIFHKPNEFHAFKSAGKSSLNLVACSFVSFSPAIQFFANKSFTLDEKERNLISLIINEARQTFRTPMHIPFVEQVLLKSETPFASQQLILLYMELFLITCRRIHSASSTHKSIPKQQLTAGSHNARETLFNQIVSYMETHICDQLTVQSICDAFSISRSTLHTVFYDRKGCGPMEYFNEMKIDKAKELIRNGIMNFTEIAYFLSFSSLPYFSKRFKKATGMSPLEYASSVKGMADALRKSAPAQETSSGKYRLPNT